jgi:uncharacterized protein (TIGR02646 family)
VRGITKPWPPRDVYPDGQQPASLREAEKAYLDELPKAADKVAYARSEYNRLEKRKLRAEMYREQRALCVYCENRIAEGNPTPRIDHWRPLSLEPELALCWQNLYLSCHSQETCDCAKGDRPFRWHDADSHMPWPTDLRYEDIVGFSSSGQIYVRSDVALPEATRRALELVIADCPDGARIRRGIANLNHPALVAARAAALDSERTRLERAFKDTTASKDEREERAIEILTQERLPAFVSIRVAWLRKRLGRGR